MGTESNCILNQYAQITRGESPSPGWGSRRDRAEAFVRRQVAKCPSWAAEVAREIEKDSASYSETTGLPPGALARICLLLRGGI